MVDQIGFSIKLESFHVLYGEAIIGLSSVSTGSEKDKTKLWHLRLGYMSVKGLMELQKQKGTER